MLIELQGEVVETMGGEIEIVGEDIERLVRALLHLDVLKHQRALSHTARAQDGHQAALPIDARMEETTERQRGAVKQ